MKCRMNQEVDEQHPEAFDVMKALRAFSSKHGPSLADAAYARFLADNGVSDFDTEKAALGQIYSQLLTDSYNVTAQLSEAEGRLGATSAEFGRGRTTTTMSRSWACSGWWKISIAA